MPVLKRLECVWLCVLKKLRKLNANSISRQCHCCHCHSVVRKYVDKMKERKNHPTWIWFTLSYSVLKWFTKLKHGDGTSHLHIWWSHYVCLIWLIVLNNVKHCRNCQNHTKFLENKAQSHLYHQQRHGNKAQRIENRKCIYSLVEMPTF